MKKKNKKEKVKTDKNENIFYFARNFLTDFMRDALTLIFTCLLMTIVYTGSFALKLHQNVFRM